MGALAGAAAQQCPGGLDGLSFVNIALTWICILRRSNNRIGRIRGFIGVLDAIEILHVGNSSRHIFARNHLIPERGFPLIVSIKGNGLGIAVNNLNAFCTQRFLHTVGCHTKANRHPQQAVGSGLIHVVRNRSAVNAVILHASFGTSIVSMVVSAVGAGDGLLVSGGQTGTGLEAEVRGVCLRGVIAGVSIIVGIAVGVKDNDTA